MIQKDRENLASFHGHLELEHIREETMRKRAKAFLQSAPKGALLVKPRKQGNSYYWCVDECRGGKRNRKQININGNQKMISALAEKKLQKEILRRCDGNQKQLERLKREFLSVDSEAIKRALPPQYGEVFQMLTREQIERREKEPYSKAAFNPAVHIHETDFGLLVRSKSEQLLANALYAYGVPFHYEEELIHKTGIRRRIFPDFTILLPDGEKILWEHLGLLSQKGYCADTAEKLHIFQLSGYTIGKNLILTMDDARGDCSSAVINQIIRSQILPHFQRAC